MSAEYDTFRRVYKSGLKKRKALTGVSDKFEFIQ